MNILLSAYACEPGKGSEPAVGWNWLWQVARDHDVWVITRESNRAAIQRYLTRTPMPNVQWEFVDIPRPLRFWKRGEIGLHLYYYVWQLLALGRARRLAAHVNFDVAHHVTFGRYWAPSFLALLGVPFVFGPVGGGETAPLDFWRTYSGRGLLIDLARSLGRACASLDPLLRMTASRAAVAVAATDQTAVRLRRLGARRVLVHPQCGVSREEWQKLSEMRRTSDGTVRLIGIGRLVHWKGFQLTIRAFAALRRSDVACELWIVNDGPELRRLGRLARELGVEKETIFWGKLPTLEEAQQKLADSDILVHPALHEAFGNVCLEAMTLAKPVVCLDLGGPAVQVSEETGFKIAAVNVDQTVTELAQALHRLIADPELRERMGRAGAVRAREQFDWDQKGRWMNAIYEEIREATSERSSTGARS